MYLLNHEQIRRYVALPRGTYLDIINFDNSRLQHTSYYFGIGRDCEIYDREEFHLTRMGNGTPGLTLPQGGYAIIKSNEVFMLSEKVLGILGPVSDLMRLGLELVHSPFIDPLFYGQLELGLWNRLPRTVTLSIGQIIGKVSFFDISDTYPIEMVPKSAQEEKFKRRRPLRDDDPVHIDKDEP